MKRRNKTKKKKERNIKSRAIILPEDETPHPFAGLTEVKENSN